MTVTSLFVYYFGICLLFKTGMFSFHIIDIDITYKHFRLKAIVSQWLHRCTTIGVFVWKTRRRRFESLPCFFFLFLSFFSFFFFFFFFRFFLSDCVCVEM